MAQQSQQLALDRSIQIRVLNVVPVDEVEQVGINDGRALRGLDAAQLSIMLPLKSGVRSTPLADRPRWLAVLRLSAPPASAIDPRSLA